MVSSSLRCVRCRLPHERRDNLSKKQMDKSEESGSSGMRNSSRTKRGPASVTHAVRWKKAPTGGADPSMGKRRST